MNMNLTRYLSWIAGVLCISLFISTSLADANPALKLAPRGANAVMTIDVAKLIQSPLGKASELQSKLISGYADRPLAVPATARRVTLVAGVHPVGLESIWQVAIVELSNEPRLDAMLRQQGGYLDTIEGKPAAWSKRDIYYVQLDSKTLGVVRPAQRQFVSRWIAGKNEAPPSPYLTSALSTEADADAVFAVDMDGVIAMPAITYALGMGDLPSLEKIEPATQSTLLRALASVKGMKITMRATDKLNAEWVIDFGQDVTALGAQAKPFIIDVLTAANLYEGNAEKWDFKVEGKRIVGKGAMDLEGLSRLVALLGPGDVSTGEEASAGPPMASVETPAPPAADPQKAAATASLKYYRAVAKSLDNLGPKISPTQGAVWLTAQAKLIEQLPLLNVDPALVSWGNQVVEAYRRGAQELATGQINAKNAALGVASPTAQGTYDSAGEGSGGDSPESRAAYRNAQQQRRQAAQSERVAAAGRALNYFNQIAPLRGQLRAEMTQKYGIEF